MHAGGSCDGQLGRDEAAHRVADQLHRAERQSVEHSLDTARVVGDRDVPGRQLGLAEAGQIEGHGAPVARGRGHILQPVLPRAAEAVDEYERRSLPLSEGHHVDRPPVDRHRGGVKRRRAPVGFARRAVVGSGPARRPERGRTRRRRDQPPSAALRGGAHRRTVCPGRSDRTPRRRRARMPRWPLGAISRQGRPGHRWRRRPRTRRLPDARRGRRARPRRRHRRVRRPRGGRPRSTARSSPPTCPTSIKTEPWSTRP